MPQVSNLSWINLIFYSTIMFFSLLVIMNYLMFLSFQKSNYTFLSKFKFYFFV